MKRTSLAKSPCPIGRSVDAIGDWWSILIVREAMLGVTRFSDFERRLGLSRNVLAVRLRKLVAMRILEKIPRGGHADYVLTEAGRDLFTTMTALRQWGDRWLFGADHNPLVMRTSDGGEVAEVRAISTRGNPLSMSDIRFGPPRADKS